jgi:hypothetical protein
MPIQPFPKKTPAAHILTGVLELGRSPLGPGRVKSGPWQAELRTLSDAELLGVANLRDRDAASAVRTGLLLLGDDLNASHDLSQSIQTANGSYWHGIMHRREPDYSNAKYWFRQVGDHPVFAALAGHVDQTAPAAGEINASGTWDSFAMVDAIESCERGPRGAWRGELEALQELEALVLLDHCYSQATR